MIKGAISPTPLAPSPSIPGWVSSVEPPSENLIVSGRRLVDRQVLIAQADLFLVTSWSKREGNGSTSKPDQLCCFSKCQLAEVTLRLKSCLLRKTNPQLQITVKHKMLPPLHRQLQLQYKSLPSFSQRNIAGPEFERSPKN